MIKQDVIEPRWGEGNLFPSRASEPESRASASETERRRVSWARTAQIDFKVGRLCNRILSPHRIQRTMLKKQIGLLKQ
jgi:hypothetical protein